VTKNIKITISLLLLMSITVGSVFALEDSSVVYDDKRTILTAPSAPISLDISFSDAPALNQTTEVTCTITSVIDAFNTTAKVVLPEGLTMVGGDLSWKGDMYGTHVSKVNASGGTTIQFKAVVKAVKTGDWIVEASAKSMSEDGWTGIGGRESVYVSIYEDSASMSDSPPPDPYAGFSKKAVRIDPPRMVVKKLLKQNKIAPQTGNLSKSELRRVPDSLFADVVMPNNSTLGSGHGQIQVEGHYLYQDIGGSWNPCRWITVWIYDYDSEGGDDYLGSTQTDENGYFISDPIDNNDEEGGGQDVYVQFLADNSAVSVINSGIYDGFTDIEWGVPDGTVDVGCWGPPTDEMPAWRAFDYMLDGWSYLANDVYPSYTTPFQVAHWPSDSSGYARGGGIYLDDSASDCDVVVHEYGHAIMYRVYGDELPPNPNCNPHYICIASSAGCAWTEGWANFFPLAVYDDEYYTNTADGYSYNLETRNDGNCGSGDDVEGNVAASLWDIYDDHDEMYDRLSDGFSNIWHVLHDQTTDEDTFKDFYDSWCALGHDKSKANSAIFQNDIDYNLPPGVVVTNPEPGNVYFGIIHTLTYTTDEDGDVPQVEIWFSRDNIEWHILDLPIKSGVKSDGYATCGEEEFWYVDWDTTHEIDEDDSVWLRVYATDNLGASSSDDTDGSFTVDNVAPHHWRDFTPTDWVADQTPDCTIEAKDITAGMDVSTAYYKYSTDGGTTWSGWISASSTGSDGTTSYQTITATAVPFNYDSGTQNKIKFKIDDVAGNTGESDEYTVKIDATGPPAPIISSSTHPDEDEWYTNNDPSFIWTTSSDTSGIDCYSYIFDQSATTTPDTTCEPAGNSRSYTDVADGIWYFHLIAKDNAGNWGSVDHYMVKIGGETSTTDAVIALQIAASGSWDANADVSGDHRVTSLDALMILQAAAGAIDL